MQEPQGRAGAGLEDVEEPTEAGRPLFEVPRFEEAELGERDRFGRLGVDLFPEVVERLLTDGARAAEPLRPKVDQLG